MGWFGFWLFAITALALLVVEQWLKQGLVGR